MSHPARCAKNARPFVGVATAFLAGQMALPMPARAARVDAVMPVSITMLAGCSINARSVAFPALSSLSAARTATGILRTTCTDTTPFNIGLDQGSGAGASTTVRLMSGPPSAFIAYGLFQNSALSANFGNTVGSDTVPGTGLDTSLAITVYAEVPSQAAPKPGAYADVVNVVVTF